MRVAHRVASGLPRLPVHAAVQFDDEAPLRAAEINDVLTNRVLAAKLESLQPEVSQQAPGGLFRCGLRLTKVARPGDLHWPTCQRSTSAETLGLIGFHGFDPLTRRLRATLSPKGARGSYPGPRPRPRPVPQRGEGQLPSGASTPGPATSPPRGRGLECLRVSGCRHRKQFPLPARPRVTQKGRGKPLPALGFGLPLPGLAASARCLLCSLCPVFHN
jgi:hypothetical protein